MSDTLNGLRCDSQRARRVNVLLRCISLMLRISKVLFNIFDRVGMYITD